MSDDPHSRGGPPTYVADGAHAPSHAERSRTLLAGEDAGTLSTLALDPAGFPFGSVVTYALDDAGAPLVLMSTMAEHARNLDGDARCSLLVTAGGDGAGRLAAARATLVGTCAPVPDDAADAASERYLAAHPDAFWARLPDFFVARLDVVAIRYVRGFGEMSWVDAGAYASAEPDPLDAAEAGIVEHMNDDHADALMDLTMHHLAGAAPVTGVTMLACDRHGFEVRLDLPPGDERQVAFGRIGFPERLDEPGQARDAMVALVRALPD